MLKNYFFYAVLYLELVMNEKRKAISKRSTNSFFHEYNFEIKVTSLMALGIFLLVENMEIKHFIYEIIRNIVFSFGDLVKIVGSMFLVLIKKIEISDLVGISIIFYVLYLVAERQRERLIKRSSNVRDCPGCQGNLHRLKKSVKHKIMSYIYFVNVKNYRCKDCSKNVIKFVR